MWFSAELLCCHLKLQGFPRTKNTHMVTFDLYLHATPLVFIPFCWHGKFETLGALGISVMLLGTAGGIAWHALDILLGLFSAAPEIVNQSLGHEQMHSHHHGGHPHGIDMDHPILALSMTIISISVKEGLYWITKRAGEREGSGLMKANAWHHRADAVSSFVALIGVGGSMLGVKFLDPLAGIVVSGMILKAGLETGYQSLLELVDAAVPSQQLDLYKQTILQVEGVKGCNHLRGRRAGSSLYLDVNIEVDPFSSVSAAHEVGENVRHQIQKLHPEVAEVFIHIDPAISLFAASATDQGSVKETECQNRNLSSEHKDIEDTVSDIFSSKFSGKMVLERITPHLLGDKILLQIEVSMPPDILIRDAMKLAEAAEREILKAVPDAVQVCILLRLGHAIP
ncbi:metal tolerance protein C1 isoform X2 [Actinidia eriantha]|uniref:metal tolerance protein C1 isoform X2 n=1 Tax=Actinidia eriantha TaxID=165200 RepID=UPI002584759E|nr:metal tolerance protein C1 isoform X2 [Actinidia eriantha]